MKQSTTNIVVLCFLLVAVASAAEDCKAKMQEFTAKCRVELSLSDDDLAALARNPPYPARTKCFLKCITEKFGIFRDNKLDEAAVKKMIDEVVKNNPARVEKAITILNQCKVISEKDPCETASKMYICAINGAKQLGLGID